MNERIAEAFRIHADCVQKLQGWQQAVNASAKDIHKVCAEEWLAQRITNEERISIETIMEESTPHGQRAFCERELAR